MQTAATTTSIIRALSFEEFAARISDLSPSRAHTYDSYSLSPAYYAFTGRLGTNIFADINAAVCTCVHPNAAHTTLVFPEISEHADYNLTFEVIQDLLDQGKEVQLARFTQEQKTSLEAAFAKSRLARHATLRDMQETILDWHFPTHTLDTCQVLARTGGKFEQLRQRLRKLPPTAFTVAELDINRDMPELSGLAAAWASTGNFVGYSQADLFSPAATVFRMLRESRMPLSAQVIRVDGQIQSYCVSDVTACRQRANQLVTASAHDIPGLSEWQLVSTCRSLAELGVAELNLGGSETHGLDRYKRKFGPIKSLALYSLKITVKEP